MPPLASFFTYIYLKAMILKLIHCNVSPPLRMAFSRAQELWKATRFSPGFIAQTGGWDQDQPQDAWVFSFWETADHLRLFMDNKHDDIALQNRQSETYHSIIVRQLMSSPGLSKTRENITQILQHSTCVHLEEIQDISGSPNTSDYTMLNTQASDSFSFYLRSTDESSSGVILTFQGGQDHPQSAGSMSGKLAPPHTYKVLGKRRISLEKPWWIGN